MHTEQKMRCIREKIVAFPVFSTTRRVHFSIRLTFLTVVGAPKRGHIHSFRSFSKRGRMLSLNWPLYVRPADCERTVDDSDVGGQLESLFLPLVSAVVVIVGECHLSARPEDGPKSIVGKPV